MHKGCKCYLCTIVVCGSNNLSEVNKYLIYPFILLQQYKQQAIKKGMKEVCNQFQSWPNGCDVLVEKERSIRWMSIISWQWRWPHTKKCETKTISFSDGLEVRKVFFFKYKKKCETKISFSAGLEVVLPPDSLCPDSLRACSYDQIYWYCCKCWYCWYDQIHWYRWHCKLQN